MQLSFLEELILSHVLGRAEAGQGGQTLLRKNSTAGSFSEPLELMGSSSSEGQHSAGPYSRLARIAKGELEVPQQHRRGTDALNLQGAGSAHGCICLHVRVYVPVCVHMEYMPRTTYNCILRFHITLFCGHCYMILETSLPQSFG